MLYNLTENQRQVLRRLVALHKAGELEESFLYFLSSEGMHFYGAKETFPIDSAIGAIEALVDCRLLIRNYTSKGSARLTITQAAIDAVNQDFKEPEFQPDYLRLYAFLSEQFKIEELRTIATLLNANHENIEGNTISVYARELIAYMKNRGQLWELIRVAFSMK